MSELDNITNRFAKKVDSLNWQSSSFQKRAKDLHKQQIKELFNQLMDEANDVEAGLRWRTLRQKVEQL